MNRLIVVGAGPAGLTLAYQLARSGQPVTLIDARRDFARGLRGDALMPCGLEALARMGLWDLLEALPKRQLADWSVWIEGRQLFRVPEPMGALQPCRLVPQQQLLEALLQKALALPSFSWLPGQAVLGLLEDSRVRGVRLRDGRTLEGDLVIGCDGRDSTVRRAAGLPLQGLGAPLELLWLVLPRPAMEGVDGDGVPAGFLTLVANGAISSVCRGASGDLQLGWLLEPGEATPQRSAMEWAEAIATLAPPSLANLLRQQGSQLMAPQRFSVQMGLATRWHRPGVLLLGDAAHPMSPIRAQGINQALRDSLVAAQELGQAAAAMADEQQRLQRLDQACAAIEARRRPEIQTLQALQLDEAQQGQRIGHSALLRQGLAWASPALGPVARAVWSARQRPLREGAVWL